MGKQEKQRTRTRRVKNEHGKLDLLDIQIAWFGYEETIRELANELELEV
jgi:hypothetical protein